MDNKISCIACGALQECPNCETILENCEHSWEIIRKMSSKIQNCSTGTGDYKTLLKTHDDQSRYIAEMRKEKEKMEGINQELEERNKHLDMKSSEMNKLYCELTSNLQDYSNKFKSIEADISVIKNQNKDLTEKNVKAKADLNQFIKVKSLLFKSIEVLKTLKKSKTLSRLPVNGRKALEEFDLEEELGQIGLGTNKGAGKIKKRKQVSSDEDSDDELQDMMLDEIGEDDVEEAIVETPVIEAKKRVAHKPDSIIQVSGNPISFTSSDAPSTSDAAKTTTFSPRRSTRLRTPSVRSNPVVIVNKKQTPKEVPLSTPKITTSTQSIEDLFKNFEGLETIPPAVHAHESIPKRIVQTTQIRKGPVKRKSTGPVMAHSIEYMPNTGAADKSMDLLKSFGLESLAEVCDLLGSHEPNKASTSAVKDHSKGNTPEPFKKRCLEKDIVPALIEEPPRTVCLPVKTTTPQPSISKPLVKPANIGSTITGRRTKPMNQIVGEKDVSKVKESMAKEREEMKRKCAAMKAKASNSNLMGMIIDKVAQNNVAEEVFIESKRQDPEKIVVHKPDSVNDLNGNQEVDIAIPSDTTTKSDSVSHLNGTDVNNIGVLSVTSSKPESASNLNGKEENIFPIFSATTSKPSDIGSTISVCLTKTIIETVSQKDTSEAKGPILLQKECVVMNLNGPDDDFGDLVIEESEEENGEKDVIMENPIMEPKTIVAQKPDSVADIPVKLPSPKPSTSELPPTSEPPRKVSTSKTPLTSSKIASTITGRRTKTMNQIVAEKDVSKLKEAMMKEKEEMQRKCALMKTQALEKNK